MLKAEIRNIMIEEESPLPSIVYGSPRPPFQPFPLPVEKEVLKLDYLKTTTFSVDTVKANVIKANSADSIKKWALVLKQALRTEFLHSLVTGERKRPVITFANPNGHTANIILKDPTTGEVTITKKDDAMLYQHDFVRAYQLVYAMFGDCLHYLISKEIKAR
jgi:hypothetical protein